MSAGGRPRLVEPQEIIASRRHLPTGVVEDLGHQAEDGLGGQRGSHPTLDQTGQPPEFLQWIADGLCESRQDLVHAYADVHMGHLGPLGRGE